MKILTIERDHGTHIVKYELGEADSVDAEGFTLIQDGAIDLDTDTTEELESSADAIFEVDSIASHSNRTRIK